MACAEVATYPLNEHRDGAVDVDGNGDSERFAHSHPPWPLDFGTAGTAGHPFR